MDQFGQYWYESNMLTIENYNLFGEQGDLPDVVHCETIETRSLVHDWEFKPHRHARLHQFLLIDAGRGAALIEDAKQDISDGDLVNLPMGIVHGFSFERGTQGWVVTVASELMDESLHDTEGLRPLLQIGKVVPSSPEVRSTVQSIFAEYPNRTFARAHILRALCGVLVGVVARALSELEPDPAQTEHALQRRFEMLLEVHHTAHLSVSDYADMLAVTPTHLSRVMRQATGQSASAIIETRIIREARRNLAFSNLSVSEVGYQLGFNDPSYFSRVFKRSTGKSPREYRRRLES